MNNCTPKLLRRLESRPISTLKAHPLNARAFDDLTGAAFETLKADIERRGLQHPVDILPDGTIISGHQRVLVGLELGWTEIKCRVRFDLDAAGPDAVALALVNDNVQRRHLSKLQKTRAFLAIRGIENAAQCSGGQLTELLDELGEYIGACQRSARRYVRIIGTPREIQHAFDRGEISINAADKVANLSEVKQRQLADKIRQGGSPKALVTAALPKKPDPHAEDQPLLPVPQITAALEQLAKSRQAGAWTHPRQLKALRRAIDALVAVLV
ncbi:MAG: ParB N-terminal domain-containing protein [Pirellulales bacterium]|nr:ParB N-terminal domain-containing protein [Pirellulales bacterium]